MPLNVLFVWFVQVMRSRGVNEERHFILIFLEFSHSHFFNFLVQIINEHALSFDYFNIIWIGELLLKPFNKLGAHINMLKQ
jgi:hypothetical protein